MSKKQKLWIKIGIAVILILVVGYIGYRELFAEGDRLTIQDGKVSGAKPTWLIGQVEENNGERYYKLADVGAPRNFVTDKTVQDPDGDPITTFFAFVGKDPEKTPGTILVQPAKGSLEKLSESGEIACAGIAEWAGQEGCLSTVKEKEDGEKTAAFWIRSPYENASIEIQVTGPAAWTEEELLALLETATASVVPGKKLSPLMADIKLNFLDDNRWTYLWNGLGVTLEITFFAVIIGILIGVVVAAIRSTWETNNERMRPGAGKTILAFFNSVCKVYLTVIRGTPVVIQLMIMYYIIFASSRNGVLIAILSFGINSGAYVAEIIRGGIMSVDKGQTEAGRSLGFNFIQTMWHIVIPQAMKAVLPSLANEFIVLLKETSVAGYVAVKDLTKGGDIIRGVTYSAFLPLIAVALIYLILVMFFTWLVGRLERRLRSSDH